MESPPSSSPSQDAATAARFSLRRVRLAVWGVLAVVLLGFIAFGSVPAVSYTYYAFSGRLVRLSPQRSLIDIWRDAIAEMPAFSVGWLPGAMIVASVVLAVLCAIGGSWILLMQAPDTRRRSTRAE
jgi:hypothetical protein